MRARASPTVGSEHVSNWLLHKKEEEVFERDDASFAKSTHKTKSPRSVEWGLFEGCKSLTMTYFHTGTRTIIGAEAFHCPVRDGKEWDHLAMVIRHKGLLS